VIAGNSTDGLIVALNMSILEDLSDEDMRHMNYAAHGDQRDPAAVASDFRRTHNL
jgi:glycine betaine/choline ABC-type transport system substrate-binding protein